MIIYFNILPWIIGLKNKIATTYKKTRRCVTGTFPITCVILIYNVNILMAWRT
ncbi:hypothetical protein BN132_1923 [Cronobacter turicensis 564]|nr:hypothetical protein BN132_1923 [Cronobacter turicensis 564]